MMLTKKEEQKYFSQMQEGMRLALEAAHYLGGRMTISYDPPKEDAVNPIAEQSRAAMIKTRTDRGIELFRMVMDSKNKTMVAKQFEMTIQSLDQEVMYIKFAVQAALQDPKYKDAPIQPYGHHPQHGAYYDISVAVMRANKAFLHQLLNDLDKEWLYTFMSRYFR